MSLFCAACVVGAAASGAEAADSALAAPIPYATVRVISRGDSDAVIAEKAAKVLPRPSQMDWMRLERTFFIHFGPNTFRGVEWGDGHEDPSLFNPTAHDADQWMRAVRDGGGKLVILVCKHHDGFCLWPRRYTGHSVASSPWRGGKGNEVREVAEAARRYGIKLGVYLSPADLYQLRTNSSHPGGMQTRTITLANPNTFSHVGVFSGGSIAPSEIADMNAYKKKVKVVFFSFGSREGGAAGAKANADALNQAGINSYYYESPLTAHEWQSWRRSLYQFAQLIFKN